jgi:hypothetical protein
VAVVVPPIDRLAPWVVLVAWWIALTRFRRRWPWLRSAPIAVGLIVATLFADAAVVIASSRMSAPGGRSFATFVLWVAAMLSVTTYAILRTPSGGGGPDDSGGGGSKPPRAPPEPPWWPDFERDFREYSRRMRRPRPRTPVGHQ